MNRKELQERIIKIRKDNSLSQNEFAKSINTTLYRVSRWELGLSVPTVKDILNICNNFNISVDYLLGRTDFK